MPVTDKQFPVLGPKLHSGTSGSFFPEFKSKVFILGCIIIMVFCLIYAFMANTFRTVQILQPQSASGDQQTDKINSKHYTCNTSVKATKECTKTIHEVVAGPRKQNLGQKESAGNELYETLFGRGFDGSPPYRSSVTQVCEENNFFLNINSTAMTDMSATKVNSFSFQPNGVLTMSIQTYDVSNRPKLYGGDAILAWATEENGNGKVAAKILDNSDGTYSVTVLMFWTGPTRVNFKLVSSAEAFCKSFPDWNKYGKGASAKTRNNYSFTGFFMKGDVKKSTECGPLARLYMGEKLCNFTSLNGGISWFCIKPKHESLTCSDIKWFRTAVLRQNNKEVIPTTSWKISKDQEFRNVSFTAGNQFKRTTELLCKDRKPIESWIEPRPSGFWKNGKWYFINCDSKLKHNILDYRRCLKNKNIYLVGDSTVRQYAMYFFNKLLEVTFTDLKLKQSFGSTERKIYQTYDMISKYNISLMNLRHEMPYHGSEGYPSAGITSVPQILRYIANSSNDDESIILMVTYNAHYAIFPFEVFRDRVRHLSKSIEILLQTKPKAKIFVKSTYPTYKDLISYDVKICMLFHEILLEEFSYIMDRVVLLDVWSIVVAHEEADLHPHGNALTSEIQQFMSYLC